MITYFNLQFLMAAIFLTLLSCSKDEEPPNCMIHKPNCIDHKIESLKKERVRSPPAEVWEWKVDNSIYYYITSNCCDQYNLLHDNECNIICAPDGGNSGEGDGNCPNFSGTILKTLRWKDPR